MQQGAVNEARAAFRRGALGDALAMLDEMVRKGEERGSPAAARQAASSVGSRAAMYIGDFARAEAFAVAYPSPGLRAEVPALCQAYGGESDQPRKVLGIRMAELRIGTEQGEAGTEQVFALLEIATVLRAKDDAGTILRHLEPAKDHLPLLPRTTGYSYKRLLGDAATLVGNVEQARSFYQRAVADCLKTQHRPEGVLARLGLAEVLLDHYPAERSEAMGQLDAAIAEFRDMKMQPSLERALKRKEILGA